MSGTLQAHHRDDLHQIAHVQGWSRRIKADVVLDPAGREGSLQLVSVSVVAQQTAPLQVIEEIRIRGHGASA